jgi:hypothetical protein
MDLMHWIICLIVCAALAKFGSMLFFAWLGKRGEFFFNNDERRSKLPDAIYFRERITEWPWIVWAIAGPILFPIIWLALTAIAAQEIAWRIARKGPFEKGAGS